MPSLLGCPSRCLFVSTGPAPGSDNLVFFYFRVTTWEGGRRDLKHVLRRRVQLIVRFTVYMHAISELSIDSDRVISGCRSDRSRTAVIRIKVFTRKGSFYFSTNKPVIRIHVTAVHVEHAKTTIISDFSQRQSGERYKFSRLAP